MKGPRYLLQNEKLTYPHTGRVTAPQIEDKGEKQIWV